MSIIEQLGAKIYDPNISDEEIHRAVLNLSDSEIPDSRSKKSNFLSKLHKMRPKVYNM